MLRLPRPAGDEDALDNADTAECEKKPCVRLQPRSSDEKKYLESREYEEHNAYRSIGRNLDIALSRPQVLKIESTLVA
jgi:hypothetical protein